MEGYTEPNAMQDASGAEIKEKEGVSMKSWINTGRIRSSSADSWRSPLKAYEYLRTNATAAFGR